MHLLSRRGTCRCLHGGSSSGRLPVAQRSAGQHRGVATGTSRSFASLGLSASESPGVGHITPTGVSSATSWVHAASSTRGFATDSKVSFEPVEVERPNTDYREYRLARLSNNLKVVIVSDPKCDRAAAALSVQVGSIFDPPEIQGLAHFCEHMLFLGTEKFPEESEYNSYLAKNGGFSNAYTAESVTNYFFGVKPEAFDGALDRFAQFFISPLFTESATERELLAVDSEHSKNLQQDGWRQQQLLRASVNEAHPLNHFMTGNSQTLRDTPAREGVNVRAALLDFHAQYYSANLMSLVMVGREDPQALLAMAEAHFAPILDRGATVPRGSEIGRGAEAFPPDRRARVVHVVPVSDVRTANFQFIIPAQRENWRSKPARYVCHLIGHEGQGSLLAALKHRGFATELSAGESLDEAGVGMLSVTVVLTEHGEANIETVGSLLFAYIRLLRERGPEQQIFKELQCIADLGFRFRSLTDSVTTASQLAHTLPDFPPEFILSAGTKVWDYEAALIEDLLCRLVTENLRLVLSSKSYAERCKMKELWYGTQHADEPLDLHLRDRWDSASSVPDLFIPQPNPFVPENLEQRPPESTTHPDDPELLVLDFNVNGVDVDRVVTAYFRKDEQFDLPKAVCTFQIYCPFARESVEQRELAELWCLAVKEELSEFSYDAHVAGLNYSLQASSLGITLGVSGYNDKLPELLAAVSSKMAGLSQVSKDTFDIVYRILERDLSNAAARSPPYQQAFVYESCMLGFPAHSLEERLAAVRSVRGCEALAGVGSKLLTRCHLECLLQGNLTSEEARGLVRSFVTPLAISQPLDSLPSRGVARLPPGWTQLHRSGTNPDELNGAVLVTLQVAEENLRNRCLVNLAGQVLGQRFFDELRTKQQLGYIVSASAYGERECFVGLRLVVQSERAPHEVAERMWSWLEDACNFLETNLTPTEFSEYRAALTSKLRERTKSLGEEFGRNWTEVASRGFSFQRREELAKLLDSLELADLQRFTTDCIRRAPAACIIVSPAGSDGGSSREGSFKTDRYWTQSDVLEFRQGASWRVWDTSLRKPIMESTSRQRSRL